MSDLVVLAFDSEQGAEQVRDVLAGMQQRHLITLADAAVVVRKQDGKVKVKQAVSLVGQGALGGAFWGMLIGIIFWMPWLGMAVGALSGALGGALSDIGVDDKFIKEVGNTIEPGNSALFLLVYNVVTDKVVDGLKPYNPTVLQTSLSTDEEAKLREMFAAEEIEA